MGCGICGLNDGAGEGYALLPDTDDNVDGGYGDACDDDVADVGRCRCDG